MAECGGWTEESHGLRKEAVLISFGAAVDTSVSLARQQQGERPVAGVGIVFWYHPISSFYSAVSAPHYKLAAV